MLVSTALLPSVLHLKSRRLPIIQHQDVASCGLKDDPSQHSFRLGKRTDGTRLSSLLGFLSCLMFSLVFSSRADAAGSRELHTAEMRLDHSSPAKLFSPDIDVYMQDDGHAMSPSLP